MMLWEWVKVGQCHDPSARPSNLLSLNIYIVRASPLPRTFQKHPDGDSRQQYLAGGMACFGTWPTPHGGEKLLIQIMH